MHTRNTVIMAVLLLGLATYVYFTEIRGRAEREQAEKDATLLVRFEPEEVTGVEVTTAEGTVVAERADGSWQIVAPLRVDTDSAAIDRLVDDLHAATQERVIVETAEDVAAYGLQEPDVRVTLRLGEGRQLAVAIGKDTPVGFNLYASVDGTTVYSAPRALRDNLGKKLIDLRDRSLVTFEQDAVRRLQIDTAGYTADLQRQDGDADGEAQWLAAAPFTGRADAETVDDLLSSLSSAQVEAFVLDEAPDVEARARFGLDAPQATLTLWTADDASVKLLLGAESTEPAGLYATRDGGAAVFVVGADLLAELPEGADDLRNKQVLALARDRVRAIELLHGDVDARVERSGTDWALTRPRPLAADASAVSGMLSALQDLRAERFGENLGEPQLRIQLVLGTEEEPQQETVELLVGAASSAPADASSEEQPATLRPVTASGDDTVYLVPDVELTDLFADAFALRAKTLVEFDNSAVQEITVEDGEGNRWLLRRDGEEWQLEGNADFDASKAADLLWDLNYLRMEQVGTEWDAQQPDLSEYGLQAPRYRVVATGDEGPLAAVSIGADAPASDTGARVWVTVDGQPGAFAVSGRLLDAVEALAESLRDTL